MFALHYALGTSISNGSIDNSTTLLKGSQVRMPSLAYQVPLPGLVDDLFHKLLNTHVLTALQQLLPKLGGVSFFQVRTLLSLSGQYGNRLA